MNKADFVRDLTRVLGHRRDAQKAVEQFIRSMREAVRKGDKVLLIGFGSFYPKIRKAQNRQHPKTRELVQVPPKRTVKFSPSAELFK